MAIPAHTAHTLLILSEGFETTRPGRGYRAGPSAVVRTVGLERLNDWIAKDLRPPVTGLEGSFPTFFGWDGPNLQNMSEHRRFVTTRSTTDLRPGLRFARL